MKKALALLLALVLIVSIAPAAFATTQSTKLTTTVPGATYTLNVPKDTVIPYNATDTSIGYVTVTESSGFAEGKNLYVDLTHDDFTSAEVATTIPYTVHYDATTSLSASTPATSHSSYAAIGSLTFKGTSSGTVDRLAFSSSTERYIGDLGIKITKSAWGKALAGDYTSTITFTASVVSAS